MTPPAPTSKYRYLERIDAGGMAEVFKGIATSLEGFEKVVAIKRVLPNLSANDRFIRMFLDEARLSLYLNHTNIVSVIDVVQAEDIYFIVMEYVEGANLKKLMEAARLRSGPMPVPIAVYIGVQMCQGLDYAHNRTDPYGRVLDIVHRDVSPPNVLLSITGEVKMTDFGLAKATSQALKTDPGVVKGKFGYLSPEAARGEDVDRRTDLFAAGIVLWEMLAGRRLFQGQTDYDTLQMVRDADIPSLRALNPAVPMELEEILRKALARNVEDRFQTAQELGRRLSGYLAATGSVVTAYDVAAYMNAVFQGGVPTQGPGGSPQALTLAIQAELNRVAPVLFGGEGGSKEDPRQWLDFGFEDDEAEEGAGAAPSTRHATGYASRGGSGSDGESVLIPLASVRRTVRDTGPLTGGPADRGGSMPGVQVSVVTALPGVERSPHAEPPASGGQGGPPTTGLAPAAESPEPTTGTPERSARMMKRLVVIVSLFIVALVGILMLLLMAQKPAG
jgi:serine/threonine-protein kinase